MARRPVLIANSSGFFGDRASAMREMVEGGPIDFLTGDYLAELTMLILAKQRARDPSRGWAHTFLGQLESVLGTCCDRGIKVVTNAGGLAPSRLAAAVAALADRLGVSVAVAHIEGDDLIDRIDELQGHPPAFANLDTGEVWDSRPGVALTANAYLGAWGIVDALRGGADIVICPRITDASLVVGPAAAWHGWKHDDFDALAGAVVAGHAIECGAQITGGNFSFFSEIPGLEHPGFPIAEVAADGSCIITKHPGTGGAVTRETVTAQLLYEIDGPRYAGPDVTTRFDSITLVDVGVDRVAIRDVRGEPPPPTMKVCVNLEGGYRNSITFVLTGLDLDAKADLAERTLLAEIGARERFRAVDVRRTTLTTAVATQEGASMLLTVTVVGDDAATVGRAFSGAAIAMALASYPGFFVTTPPSDATAIGVYWPTVVPTNLITQVVVHGDGTRTEVAAAATTMVLESLPIDSVAGSDADAGRHERAARNETTTLPLGTLVGARSGDKGGNANVGVWTRNDSAWPWLCETLTVEEFRRLVPESRELEVRRHVLANLRALNFVVVGLLGRGVAATTRFDPQAKALGEWLRSRPVEIPTRLL